MFDETKTTFKQYEATYYNLRLNDFLIKFEDNDELLFTEKEIEFFSDCINASDVKNITNIQLFKDNVDGLFFYNKNIFDCLTNKLLSSNFEESLKDPYYVNVELSRNYKTTFNKIIKFLENRKEILKAEHHNKLNKLQTNPKHETIFCNNGFILFDHILNEYVKTKRGRLSDIHFFYWSMFKDKFIHQRPERFKEWFLKNHDEDLGKIKTYNEVENPDRQKHYSNALEWFKLQNH